jgi:hypothetical protein
VLQSQDGEALPTGGPPEAKLQQLQEGGRAGDLGALLRLSELRPGVSARQPGRAAGHVAGARRPRRSRGEGDADLHALRHVALHSGAHAVGGGGLPRSGLLLAFLTQPSCPPHESCQLPYCGLPIHMHACTDTARGLHQKETSNFSDLRLEFGVIAESCVAAFGCGMLWGSSRARCQRQVGRGCGVTGSDGAKLKWVGDVVGQETMKALMCFFTEFWDHDEYIDRPWGDASKLATQPLPSINNNGGSLAYLLSALFAAPCVGHLEVEEGHLRRRGGPREGGASSA